MNGILLLAGFELAGVLTAWRLFYRQGNRTRVWLGMVLGLMEMMWFPSLFAFGMTFNAVAQIGALGVAAGLAVLAHVVFRSRREPQINHSDKNEPPLWMALALVIPLTLLSGYLQYTHTIMNLDGALYSGQSTYGDLNMHLGFVTGLCNAAYPPEYTILPGTLLGYPFLTDALSASMYLLGTPLSWSLVIPGTLMMALVYYGFVTLAWELIGKRAATILSYVLMFINGGLGFLYTFDMVFRDSTMLKNVFEGHYQTPTNMPALNLRWVNVICDMMIPQRTILAGWLCVIPAIYLLALYLRTKRMRDLVILGVWAGAMPMIHTHSFVALALISAGVFLDSLIREKDRKKTLRDFLTYALIASVLALPQLIVWTFPQTASGNASGAFTFRFNWVNFDTSTHSLIDEYFWFWIKNVGIVALFIVPAALSGDRRTRALSLGVLFVFLAAELVQFQTNEYDNNKLFYVAFMVMMPITASYLLTVFDRLKGVRGRSFFAALFILVSTLSGGLSIARETISRYQLYDVSETDAAAFIRANTAEHTTFLTGRQHDNPVSSLTGRNIVCGADTFLYYHGLQTADQAQAARQMFEQPLQNLDLFTIYQVDYIFISDNERAAYTIDYAAIEGNWPLVYASGNIEIYAVSAAAQAATPAISMNTGATALESVWN